MMPRLKSAPATKSELTAAKTELSSEIASVRTDLSTEIASVRTDLSAEIASVRTDLSAEIASVRTDLSAEIASVKAELSATSKRLALGIVQTNVRIDRLADDLRGEMRAMRSDVGEKLDSAVSRMETLWRESALLPRVIDDHERRISALENRPSR